MPARILVVDDSPSLQKVVTTILARQGYATTIARDGVEALEAVQDYEPFDLIVLDFVMPRMNGLQFCRALRALPTVGKTPVVLMSAKSDKVRERFVEQTGALDAIAKPFVPSALIAVVEGVLARAGRGEGARPASKTEPALELDEDSFIEEEPRPSLLPRNVEQASLEEIVRYAITTIGPAVVAMQEPERGNVDAVARTMRHALVSGPTDALWLAIRDVASARSSEVLSGDLAIVPLPEVIQVLHMQRQTGVLRASHEATTTTLFLHDGHLALAHTTSRMPEHQLGRQFVQAGELSRAEVEVEVQSARSRGLRLGDALVESGRVSAEARKIALTRQSAAIVYDLVRWPTGRFWFTREPLPQEALDAGLELGIAGLMLEGFRRVDEWRHMESTLAWDAVIAKDELALAELDAQLSRNDRLVLAEVDGHRTIGQVDDACELGRVDAAQVVYQLLSSRGLRKLVL